MHSHESNPAGVPPEPTPPKRLLHVLCIDDDTQVLQSLKDSLEFFGHRVQAASGGKRGLELFHSASQKSDPFDVVITDLNMPEIDGYEVTRQIKGASPGTPVVLMSGLGALVQREGGVPAPVDAMLNKPPRLHELNHLLLRLARKPFDLI